MLRQADVLGLLLGFMYVLQSLWINFTLHKMSALEGAWLECWACHVGAHHMWTYPVVYSRGSCRNEQVRHTQEKDGDHNVRKNRLFSSPLTLALVPILQSLLMLTHGFHAETETLADYSGELRGRFKKSTVSEIFLKWRALSFTRDV